MQLQQQHVLDSLVAAAPANADFAHLHAFAQHDAALRQLHMGHLQQAAAFAQSALAAFRSLAASDPKIEEYRVDVGLALDDLAAVALKSGKPQEALVELQEAVQQSASVRSGSSAEFRMDRADTAALLADTQLVLAADSRRSTLERRRDREEGCRRLGEAVDTYRALSATIAEAAQDVRQSLAKADQCRARVSETNARLDH